MRVLFSFLAVFYLAGCMYDPSYMPIGYKKAREPVKALDGPDYRGLDYDYSAQMNEQVLRRWEEAVSSLVDAAEAKSAIQRSGVVLASPEKENAFTLTFDHVLRQELRSRGYFVDVAPWNNEHALRSYVELHDRQVTMKNTGGSSYDREDNPNAQVKLGLAKGRGEKMQSIIVQDYVLPLYGYGDSVAPVYGAFSRNLTEKDN